MSRSVEFSMAGGRHNVVIMVLVNIMTIQHKTCTAYTVYSFQSPFSLQNYTPDSTVSNHSLVH